MAMPFIACDLDGTIVRNEDFKILESTINDILNYQQNSGSRFFIVTGRSFETTKMYAKELEVKLPVIGCNGAVITDPITGNVIFEDVINTEISVKLIDFSIENQLDLAFYTSSAMIALTFSERDNYFKKAYADIDNDMKPKIVFIDSLEDMKEAVMKNIHKPVKFLFSFPQEGNGKIVENTKNLLSNLGLNHPITLMNNRILIDAMNSNINKATGLKKWADLVGVDVELIHTIGDNNNDIEMTKQSKFGCAVDNAVPALKNTAKTILKSIEDNGVGLYLSTLLED